MGFKEWFLRLLTGKTKEEREEDARYIADARREIQKATLEARKDNAIRVAVEKEKISADAKLKRIRDNNSRNGGILGRTLIFGSVEDRGDSKSFNIIGRNYPDKKVKGGEFKII